LEKLKTSEKEAGNLFGCIAPKFKSVGFVTALIIASITYGDEKVYVALIGGGVGQKIFQMETPYAYCFKDKVSIYVVAPEDLQEVNLENGATKAIIENAFWPSLFPNSNVKESDAKLWIGMRGGILEIVNPDSPKLLWHTKNKPTTSK
jgi:hypothetical protein